MYVVGYYHRKGLNVGFNEKTPAKQREKATAERRMPGEQVPEADLWKPHIITSHLNLGWIQTVEQHEASKQEDLAKNNVGSRTKKAPKPDRPAPKPQRAAHKPDPKPAKSKSDNGLDDMSKADLMEFAKKKGVSVRGSKQSIIDRIVAAEA